MKANQIIVDSALVVGGSSYNGSVSVRDANNAVKVTLDRTGITVVVVRSADGQSEQARLRHPLQVPDTALSSVHPAISIMTILPREKITGV
ncbi:hypothetical protein NXX23_18020 [Bacteroides ovatus]|nr:hypothetical protein [Bacteroides ovatus]